MVLLSSSLSIMLALQLLVGPLFDGRWQGTSAGSADAFTVSSTPSLIRMHQRQQAQQAFVQFASTVDEADETAATPNVDNNEDINGNDPSSTIQQTVVATNEDATSHATEGVNEIPKPHFSISSSPSGPAGSLVHTLRFHSIPGQEADMPEMVLETGKIGRLAAGAVTMTRGNSVLYATASRDDSPKEDCDFLPMSVDHQERFSSAGLTSGSYNKRDGKPAEHEVLTARLIDRPIRPLIASGWRHDTQILSWVLSYDGIRSCDPMAVTASAAALFWSDIPLEKPVAAVQVGLNNETGQFIVNPTNDQMEASRLHLTVAGTADALLMIEGAADRLPEAIFIDALQVGHEAIKVLCQGIQAMGDKLGVEKERSTLVIPPAGLQERVDEIMMERVDEMYAAGGRKKAAGERMKALQEAVKEELRDEYPENEIDIMSAFKDLLCRRMFHRAKKFGLRADGRNMKEIRQLDMETGFLPRVHGSALFTRGETQAVATATLGDAGMRQKIDRLDGVEEKRFYLQYTFPPSCVGETGRVGAPGRREVGHGNLAERALIPVIPSEDDFPYTIRVESLITESHGSSSMASVCGGCLALMDAGVPIKSPVAGIAMGLLLGDKEGVSDENAVILSDITGTEDALGTMDFKVAGDREGITTFQLDIKCEGLTLETMARALEQAREGRLHLLDEMAKVLPEPRSELPESIPKMAAFSVPFESIGKIIGPGGKQIRAIIDDFDLVNMDVSDDGRIELTSFEKAKLAEAEAFVLNLIGGGANAAGNGNGGPKDRPKYVGPEPVEGETYTGKITGIHPFGVFVEILPGPEDGSSPGLEGLVHVSELARERVRNCEAFVRAMNVEELTVKYIGKDKGKVQLSRKAVLEEEFNRRREKQKGGQEKDSDSNKSGPRRSRPPASDKKEFEANSPSTKAAAMPKEEIDVIVQALEGLDKL